MRMLSLQNFMRFAINVVRITIIPLFENFYIAFIRILIFRREFFATAIIRILHDHCENVSIIV